MRAPGLPRRGLCTVAALVMLSTIAPLPAIAQQLSVSIAPSATALTLGTIVRGSSSTTFRVDASGNVTADTGTGEAIRIRNGSASGPMEVELFCKGTNSQCRGTFRVTVTAGSGSRGLSIASFDVGSLRYGNTTQGTSPSNPSAASPLTFTFSRNPGSPSWSSGSTPLLLTLSMALSVSASGSSGNAAVPFTVTLSKL